MTGFFNCIKPTGLTSSDVVVRLKKALNRKDIGHLGTLDPMASGVLPIAVGKATRLFDYLIHNKKIYIATFLFGICTDTLDSEGKILDKQPAFVKREDIEAVLPKFLGKIQQTPPIYSAIKINGKRAYQLARDNQEVQIKSREVEIYNLKLIDIVDNKFATLKIECKGGTYIRSLGRDIANALNTVCTMVSLVRTYSSGFDIKSAKTLEEIYDAPEENLIQIEDILDTFQRFDLPEVYEKQIKNGVPLDASQFDTKFEENFCLYLNQKLFAICKVENNKIKVKTNLYTGE